jgi:hypothetical protein
MWLLSFGKIDDPEALTVQDATDNGSCPSSPIILTTTADNESTVNNVFKIQLGCYLYLGRFGRQIFVQEKRNKFVSINHVR